MLKHITLLTLLTLKVFLDVYIMDYLDALNLDDGFIILGGANLMLTLFAMLILVVNYYCNEGV